jgi:hypothetical protein
VAQEHDLPLEEYHRAGREITNGNPEVYKALYSRRGDVTLANPFGPPVRGWSEVSRTGRIQSPSALGRGKPPWCSPLPSSSGRFVRQSGRSKTTGLPVDMRFAQLWTLAGKQTSMRMYPGREEALRAAGLVA